MRAQRTWGWIAAVSGVTLLILSAFSAVAGTSWTARGWTVGSPTSGTRAAPGMMGGGYGGMGPGMMGGGHGGMGPGMMGGGAATQGATGAIAGAPAVTVTVSEFKFSPAEITLPSREANLTLSNTGALPHDIVVPGLGIRVVASAGQITTVGLRDLPSGRYAGYCSVPGHAEAGMRIAVVVQ